MLWFGIVDVDIDVDNVAMVVAATTIINIHAAAAAITGFDIVLMKMKRITALLNGKNICKMFSVHNK